MKWHVQYRDGDSCRIEIHSSPEHAIEAACRLIDAGREVVGMGTGTTLKHSIGKDGIAKIYALWARSKHPFEI
jgi:hypothetical protein